MMGNPGIVVVGSLNPEKEIQDRGSCAWRGWNMSGIKGHGL